MEKKLKVFYSLSKLMIITFISAFILVKLTIWPFALTCRPEERYLPIRIVKHNANEKHVTKFIHYLFNRVDYLLTPAFIMLFAIIAVKLVTTPNLFEQKDQLP